jgi:cobalt-zinc-cadmium efflux system outer membrane protein
MYKKIVFTIGVGILWIAANAQTNDIGTIMLEIEQNNKELKAYTTKVESRKLELKSENNLPDPQVGYYYLPWGEHTSGDYTEFQITQSFEFPTVYGARKGLREKKIEQMNLELASKRQDILLPAKLYCIELVYLNKRILVEQSRVSLAEKVYSQVQTLYEKEQVGILEINKAKIAWLQEQFNVEQIENDKRNILLLLQNLNGGNEVSFSQLNFLGDEPIDSLGIIWSNRELNDPKLKVLIQEEEVAFELIRLSKNNSLPNITAGFNYQGVSGLNYSGIYGGLSIPIWSNRNKVKASNALYEYQQSISSVKFLAAYANFQKQYYKYQMLARKLNEYQKNINSLNSDNLLYKAYELGEISFMEYYLEMQFYHQAYDSMLEMEKQLNQLKADILKHQL